MYKFVSIFVNEFVENIEEKKVEKMVGEGVGRSLIRRLNNNATEPTRDLMGPPGMIAVGQKHF